MKPSEHLQKARDLIAQPGAWTQGEFARDALGRPPTNGWNRSAVCYCAYGVLEKVTHQSFGGNLSTFLDDALGNCNGIPYFNDAPGRTQAEVVAAFDKAIALAKSEGK